MHIGTDEELQERLSNFGQNIEKEKIARNRREVERQDLEDELAKTRRSHVELINEHGELAAEAKVLIQFAFALRFLTRSLGTRPSHLRTRRTHP